VSILQALFLNFATGDNANRFHTIAFFKIQSKLIEYSHVIDFKNLLLRGGEKKEKVVVSQNEEENTDELGF